jgi:hypothetical protein
MHRLNLSAVGLMTLACTPLAWAQTPLRICEWNVTNYDLTLPSPRDAAFQTAIYGVFSGRTLSPDVIIGQEFISLPSTTAFRDMLNNAPGSPGDWAVSPFVNGADTDSAFFYRTSRITYIGLKIVAAGGPSPNHPRNLMRYDFRPKGYFGPASTIAAYSSHMKSGSTNDDQNRRLLEAQRLRDDAQTLSPAWHFLVGADFNIPASGEASYQEMVGTQANNAGRFFDPISTPGNWDNFNFRFVHTQEPSTSGMDDRFDQILMDTDFFNGSGMEYIGKFGTPYSTSTWNDPNHSYRSWGNDGTSYNQPIKTTTNAMVGQAIAQALINTCNGNGHLPVFLDLKVPAEVDSPTILDFGTVVVGQPASLNLTVTNAGDVAQWSALGIADLNYTLAPTGPFTAPSGTFKDLAGGTGNIHAITMDTSIIGAKSGSVVINSDSADQPARTVVLIGTVVDAPNCYADCDQSGTTGIDDFICFQTSYALGDAYADCDQSGTLGIDDFICFQTQFALGC